MKHANISTNELSLVLKITIVNFSHFRAIIFLELYLSLVNLEYTCIIYFTLVQKSIIVNL